MTIAEDRLLAYVDGHLSPEEAAEIERALDGDAEARALVEALRASALPFADAAEALIPVPDLSSIEASLSRPPAPRRTAAPPWLSIAAALAVFFAAGLLAGQHLFPAAPQQTSPGEQTQWARWMDDIAAYQALYTRATLNPNNTPEKRRLSQMARVSSTLGQPISAPDLTTQNAHYRYAKIFAIDGAPLVQIAYLPDTGVPFSICMTKTDTADHEPRYSTRRGMRMATWRHNGIAWVFVGGVSRADMERYIASARAQIES